MAVKDDNVYHPTEALILHKSRRHYQTTVHPLHWQLRSQIGAEHDNTIYYPGGNGNLHVQKLNTTTRESETVKLLSFSPRCLVAKNGWICCGGETGEFAAIPLREKGTGNPEMGWDADSRDRAGRPTLVYNGNGVYTREFRLQYPHPPPPDPDYTSRDDAVMSILDHGPPNRSIVAKNKSFGKERVNCITLWFPQRMMTPFQGAYSEPVAVLANNDKHVIIVHLLDMDSMDELSYPDCVNRAVLSPDGRLLVAVSDDPYLYVHERVEKFTGTANLFRNRDRTEFEWSLLRKIHLKSQRKDDKSDNRGSFAACFSNTGRYLAVGTQYGMISVFDTNALLDVSIDPLITSFASSRPNSEQGAVRDMAFSPGPFDLLAWTEDRGRVGIADARSNFVSRQILQLDTYDAFEHVIITDRGSIDPRLLERNTQQSRLRELSNEQNDRIRSLIDRGNQRSDALSSNFASTLDLSPENRRSVRRPDLDRYHLPLTPDDTLVLEALQEHRRRREQRAEERAEQRLEVQAAARAAGRLSASSTARGGSYGANADANGPPPLLPLESSRTRERSESVTRAVSDILHNIRDQRERLRDTQERLRAHTRNIEEADRRRLTAAVATSRERRGMPAPDGLLGNAETTSSSAARDQGATVRPYTTSSGGWGDLEALYNLSFESGRSEDNPEGEASPPTRQQRSRERDRAAFFGSLLSGVPLREWEDVPRHRPAGNSYLNRADSPPEPDETAGLAWSEDGRMLFVGAENGIYEFHVDIVGRKLFPSMTLR